MTNQVKKFLKTDLFIKDRLQQKSSSAIKTTNTNKAKLTN